MDTVAFLTLLKQQPFYRDQICHLEEIPPRTAEYGQLEFPLNPTLAECLKKRKLDKLYRHQADAINLISKGLNVIVATSSASGKSMCYNIPVMEAILAEPVSSAIYLFPTKALAQDQMSKLGRLFQPEILNTEDYDTYDGDTPKEERSRIRRRAKILLTNPDMLHLNILPNHAFWARLMRHLKYVVLDEAHAYRGIFGSHVSLVLRRLRRIARAYGSNPIFIIASATINNAEEHAVNLSGMSFATVEEDGAPKGGKDFIFWDPPIVDEKKGTRRSANIEAANIMGMLISRNVRSLCFTRTRRLTELVAAYTRDRLNKLKPGDVDRVKSYRAGYLANERRKIENEYSFGTLIGVIATNALELGVDIGDLDATVLTGYPGTIASTWQQAGRSGRRNTRSISFLIGTDNPLDQYIMNHPDFFFGHRFENALTNFQNSQVLKAHLLSAAWEIALSPDDVDYFGMGMMNAINSLAEEGLVKEKRSRYYLSPSVSYPAALINIRAVSGENFNLINAENGLLIETLDTGHAFTQAHEGAVYLHQGDTYVVTEFDLDSRISYAQPAQVEYYTQVKELTDLRIIGQSESKRVGPVNVFLGEVEVTTEIISYKRKAQLTDEILSEETLQLPKQHFRTVALWFDMPNKGFTRINTEGLDWPGALHAAEHAEIGLLPLFAMCDRNDIGGLSTPLHPDTGKAQIFIYDAYPGGVGISRKGFSEITNLWWATLKLIKGCLCEDGCPSCIQSPKCGNNNKPLDKKGAAILLEQLLSN